MLAVIDGLKDTYEAATLVVIGGFALGIAFGVIAEISRYCLRAAIAEWATPARPSTTNAGSHNRTAQIGIAILVALLGTQALHAGGLIDLSESIYWSVAIRPLPLIVGGLLFGIGMVLAGGCVSRLLVLAASGNARALVTILVIGISAYATLRGILALPRLELENALAFDTTPATLFAQSTPLWFSIGAIIVTALAIILTARGRGLGRAVVPGALIGGLAVFGWFLTGVVGYDDFEPRQLASLSFVAPVADSVQYLMIFTGDTLRFSIALVGGVLAGAFVSALIGGRFRFQGFTSEASVLRYLAGGVLMGFGGVTALGCTVGQGLSGLSTAAPSSMIAVTAIIAGAYGLMIIQARRSARQSYEAAPIPAE